MKQINELTSHMVDNIDGTGFLDAWFYSLIEKHLSKLCESPIEILLGAALLFQDKFDGLSCSSLSLANQSEILFWPPESKLLIPQYNFEEYRIDWVIRDDEKRLTFIECDGHDFHERTKEQASRDKQRDRKIQAAGHPILRFTGSEIYRDPLHCAQQISDFVDQRNLPPGLRERA